MPRNNRELPTRELLAEQADWLQRLARSLVSDQDEALDAVQDTLAIALTRPPRTSDRLRGWLGQVLRNRIAERSRAAAGRKARELAHSTEVRAPGADEVVERIQLQRRIADHLLSLNEETRTALVLRYYEDLPPRVIAARQGTPVATVKSRLARGLESLRSQLDADHDGERAAWVGILVPWVGLPAAPAWKGAATTGGLLMNTKLLAATAAAAIAGVFLLTRDGLGEPGTAPETAVVESARGSVPPSDRQAVQDPRPEPEPPSARIAERRPVETAPGEQPQVATLNTVAGRIVDPEGQPLGGMQVGLRNSEVLAVSDPNGAFRLQTTTETARAEIREEGWCSVRSGSWRADSTIEPVIIAAPKIRLAGFVVDEWGRPLLGARAVLELPDDFETRFAERLDASFEEDWSGMSDATGAFELDGLPAVRGAALRVLSSGYAPSMRPAPMVTLEGMWIELRRPLSGNAPLLSGRVLRANREPAEDAVVALGESVTTADERGFFELDLYRAGPAATLVAAEAGSLPARVERDGAAWPDFVDLVLGPAPLEISGRVIDSNGAPRVGGRVWLQDPSRLGRVGSMPIQVEPFLSGGAVPDEALDSLGDVANGSEPGNYGSARPALEPSAILSWVETDSNGHFAIGGLEARDYTLNVSGAGLHWGTQSDPIPAGSTGVELVTPAEATFEVVRGRVLSEDGQPVPGVTLTPWVSAFHAVDEFSAGTSDVLRFFLGDTVRTDEQGRFEIEELPRAWIQFHVLSDDIVPTYFSVEQIDDPKNFELRVPARAHLEVVNASKATRFRVVDSEGAEVTLLLMRADGYSSFDEMDLVDGRSGVVTVTTDAAELQLMDTTGIVGRIPLELRPGEVATIE